MLLPLLGCGVLAFNSSSTGGVCVGLRGNGQHVFSHFGALAKIVETLGPIQVMAGGSSATISTMLVESIQSNPLIVVNGNKQQARISFLIKSIEGIVEDGLCCVVTPWTSLMGEFNESVMQLLKATTNDENTTLLDKLQIAQNVVNFLDTHGQDVLNKLKEVGSSLSLINPEVISTLASAIKSRENPLPLINDILKNAGPGLAPDDTVGAFFVRPGIFNWEVLGGFVDLLGTYFIGYKPVDSVHMEHLLEQCAIPSLGKEWPEVAGIEIVAASGSNATCGEVLKDSFFGYLQARKENYNASNQPTRSRVLDPIGNEHLISIGLTAGLIGDDVLAEFQQARLDYSSGILEPHLQFPI